MTFPPLCLSCTAILRENFGGARRNRTADKGFADLCLTTWRPRHRTRVGRVKPGDRGLPVQFPALCCTCKLFLPWSEILLMKKLQKPTGLKTRHYKSSAGGGGLLLLAGTGFVDDGGPDEVTPLGPRAVVVAHVVVAEQILQNEPGMRAAFPDAAVGDDLVGSGDALGLIELLKILERLEGAVLVGSLRPRDICGFGDVSRALGGFVHSRRSNDLSGELVDGTNIHELAGLAAVHYGKNIVFVGAKGFIEAGDAIGGRRDVDGILGQRALLFEPFLAAAVDEPDVFVAVIFELPEGVGGEPIVVIAVKKNGGVVGNAGSAEQLFERGLVDQIAADVVLELGLPVPADSAGDMALIVGGGVHVDFDEAEIGRIQILREPIGGNENFGVFVVGHLQVSSSCFDVRNSIDAKQKTHLPVRFWRWAENS